MPPSAARCEPYERRPLLEVGDDAGLGAADSPGPATTPWETEEGVDEAAPINPALTRRLYVSHFLSAGNSRLFEFGSVLFLAAIYPMSLLPVSVYALFRAVTAVLLSPAIGLWIDRADRLQVVRTSILGERLAIATSCLILWVLSRRRDDADSWLGHGLFAVVVLLAGVEKLCSVMNQVAVTRDWVVVITDGNEAARRDLNAKIRRIDLACKLLMPFFISMIDGVSTVAAIWTTLIATLLSVATEYVFIVRVYEMVPNLRRHSGNDTTTAVFEGDENNSASAHDGGFDRPAGKATGAWLVSVIRQIFPWSSICLYVRHVAFLPSFSYALAHLTVLSFSGRMIAFLLASGYDSFGIGIARTVFTISELSATWISPRLTERVGTVWAGAWGLWWQTAWLSMGAGCLLIKWPSSESSDSVAVSGLVIGVILSRIGLWSFALAVQNIVQDAVEGDNRGTFSTVEASAQNIFEMLSYVSTIVFSRPDQFKWPMLMTMAAIYVACVVYLVYLVRHRQTGFLNSKVPRGYEAI